MLRMAGYTDFLPNPTSNSQVNNNRDLDEGRTDGEASKQMQLHFAIPNSDPILVL